MVEEEARLRFALIAQVGNASREFTISDVSQAVAAAAGLETTAFDVVPTYPHSFLIICRSQEARDRVLDTSPTPIAATHLSLRQWTRLVRGSYTVLYQRVGLELDGIPEHAWDLDTASKLLAKHAWIEKLDPATASKADMSTFKLTAWTTDPYAIPTSKLLSIAEPELPVVYPDEAMQRIFANVEPYLRQKSLLDYPIHIHLRSIADFRSRTPSSSDSSPSDDGDSGPDGNPDRFYGFRRGTGPLLTGIPRRNTGAGINIGGGDGNGDGGNAGHGAGSRRGPTTLKTTEKTNSKCGPPLQKNFPKGETNKGKQTRPTDALVVPEGHDAGTVAPAARPKTGTAQTKKRPPLLLAKDWATACAPTQSWASPSSPWQDPMLVEVSCPMDLPRTRLGEVVMGGKMTATISQEDHIVTVESSCPLELAGAELATPQRPALLTPIHHGAAGMVENIPETPPATVDTPLGLPMMGSRGPTQQAENPQTPPATIGNPLGLSTPGPQDGLAHLQDSNGSDGSPPGFSRAAARKEARLQAFKAQVQTKIQSPLAPRPARTKRVARPATELPKRSERLANKQLANVASSKRAEVLLMRRFNLIPEAAPVNTAGKQAYAKVYKSGMAGNHFEAVGDLIPALRNMSPILGMQA
ncbi:unnamed protein product [Urochloa humidicola]